MALDPSGNIVMGLTGVSGSDSYLVVVRFGPDGDLDTGFGAGGATIGPAGNLTGLTLDGQGRVVVVGNGLGVGVIWRLDTGGHADPTFAAASGPDAGPPDLVGVEVDSTTPSVVGVVVQSTGRIVYGSRSSNTASLCRLLANGGLDSSFGVGGCMVAGMSGVQHAGLAVAMSDDLYVGGTVTTDASSFYVLHTDADGQDRSSEYAYPMTGCSGNGVALDEAELVIGGLCGTIAAVTLATDSGADRTFGAAGLATEDILGMDQSDLFAVLADGSGRVLGAGSALDATSRRGVIARWTARGLPDATFGVAGVAAILPAPGAPVTLSAMAFTADGRILAAGHYPNGAAVVRVWP